MTHPLIPPIGSIPIYTTPLLPIPNMYAYCILSSRKEVRAGEMIHVIFGDNCIHMSDEFFENYQTLMKR